MRVAPALTIGEIRKVEGEDVVGRVRFFVFHFDTTPLGSSGAFDHISETAVYAQLLDEHGDLLPQACKALGTEDPYLGSVLIFDRLEILPDARGRGLGLKVLERLISKFGLGCRIAVMSSCNEWRSMPCRAARTSRYTKGWRDITSRAGFRSVKGTDHLMIKMLI
jgi:GNAT superfamily N-acetyltransferase